MGVALAVLFTAAWLPIFFFRVEDRGESMPHYAGMERFWVNLTPVLLALHTTVACVSASLEPPPAARAAAAAALLGVALGVWLWGRAQIGPLRRTKTPDEPVFRFRRDGAFGIVRHPLYFGLVLLVMAQLLGASSLAALFTAAGSLIAIAVRARQEERRLRAQLGPEYDEYARRVRRLIPFLW